MKSPQSPPARIERPTNEELATLLFEIAALLESQEASEQRVNAYWRAAHTVAQLGTEVTELLARGGRSALLALPEIDEPIAVHLDEYTRTRRCALLERLSGRADPIALFSSLDGVGPQLARKIHLTLDIDTLDELQRAVNDGRLARVSGFGARRLALLRDHLAARSRRPLVAARDEPRLDVLLDVDAEYRRRAGRLARIAPHRFNPTHERWLPVLHTERDDCAFIAMYSNTAMAHHLNCTSDWVVVYFERGGVYGERTVRTAHSGPLAGERVVRGREAELASLLARGELHSRAPDV